LLFPSDIFNNHLAFITAFVLKRRVKYIDIYRYYLLITDSAVITSNSSEYSIINETSVIWRRK